MRARRLLVLFGIVLLVGAAFAFWPGSGLSVADGMPAEGELATYRADLTGPWEEVARIPAGALGRGAILDIDEYADTLYVLQVSQWALITRGAVSTSFGSTVRGSPTWLSAGLAIRAVPGGALILDRGRQVVSRWNADGSRGAEHDFSARGAETGFLVGLSSDASGAVLVSARRINADLSGEWLVLRGRIDGAQFDTVFRSADGDQPSGIHNPPMLAPAANGSTLLMPALGWRMLSLDTLGHLSAEHVRANGPRWPVPDSVRQKFAALLDRFPPAQRKTYALPPTFPAIRDLTVDSRGRVLVLVATGIETVQAELLSPSGEPIGRLWTNAVDHLTFVANGSVFRVSEDDSFTRIERQRLLPPTN